MNILFFNYEFPPLGGGAATANYFLFKEFSKDPNLNILLITSSSDKENFYQFSKNIRIDRLDINKKGKSQLFQKMAGIVLYFVKSTIKAIQEIRRNKYDICVVFFAFPSGFTALFLKWIFGIPYIISLRGSDVPGFNERFNYMYPILRPLFRIILENSEKVVANSEDLRNLAMKSGVNKKISIIPNGIDVDFFKPAKNRKSGKSVVFLTVARLIKRKALDVLIKASSKIKTDIPFEIWLVGDGDEKESLKKLAKDLKMNGQVVFMGEASRDKINKIYRQADVFVLPSKNEGMSNALLEAMASGLPIISTNTGGTASLLRNDYLSVDLNDPLSFAEKMTRLIKNEKLRIRLSSRSRQIASKLRWSNIASHYVTLINSSVQ